jgi:hypothetical protein
MVAFERKNKFLVPTRIRSPAGRSGNRIPVEGSFSAPVQTGPEAHPASCTIDTGSFPGVKRSERGVDHPPRLAPRLKKD